jgi:dTDP-4-amino-4,6-dideoxygalactose transaminase
MIKVSIGIGEGDEVIVPSLTFVASFQAISATGVRPIPLKTIGVLP